MKKIVGILMIFGAVQMMPIETVFAKSKKQKLCNNNGIAYKCEWNGTSGLCLPTGNSATSGTKAYSKYSTGSLNSKRCFKNSTWSGEIASTECASYYYCQGE